MTADNLLAYLFDGAVPNTPAVESLSLWLRDSKRFRVFVEACGTKVRKKLRQAQGVEGMKDVLAELQVACGLLASRAFEVRYEAEGIGKTRTPDFAVTYKMHTLLHLEVKRVRAGSIAHPSNAEANGGAENSVSGCAAEPRHGELEDKLARTVVSKIGQLPPQTPNVLVIIAERQSAFALAFWPGMAAIQSRIERKDETLLLPYGFESAAAFQRQYARLSAVVCLASADDGASSLAACWKNGAARHVLGPELTRELINTLSKRP